MAEPRVVKAPRGDKLTCKNWQIEAPYRMLQNNLDPQVAGDPENLIVYGGRGKAARNWECFDAIVRSPGLAARVVGDSLHLMRHQVGSRAKPSQGRVKLGMLGQPVLEEFDIRNNDLGRGADLVPDLGHQELLAFGFRDLGGPGRGGR